MPDEASSTLTPVTPEKSREHAMWAWLRPLACASLVLPAVTTVVIYGELSAEALVAVLGAGILLAGVALARRAGSGTPALPASGRPWLWWLSLLALWEVLTFASGLPTLSDLADPLLADRLLRATAMLIWFAVGCWLATRPRSLRR